MPRRIQFAFLLLSTLCCRAEVVDRMVAVVNRQVILQSEVEQSARVEALLNGTPLEQLASQDSSAVLERLIDQDLLQQQIGATTQLDPTAEELAARVKEVRAQIPGAADDGKWKAMLAAYGITERDVETNLLAQIRVLRFVDLRFRGLVRVDTTAIATYYQETLLPELRKQGAAEPPLAQVSEKIRQILVEQRIDGLLNAWLQTLRAQAVIERMNSHSSASAGERP
ncbi:MAG TPA: SurA N-terminal domain-containing protein [Verrucomicrobiae bacterium]|jgi:peptidyl-prolyl cis-trans isomerase SurA|nr:SurA N-terminal domain-containing protein [Verrucomicrobiae bacterium]